MTNNKLYSMIKKCRICGSSSLEPILDLGRQPLANSLRTHMNGSDQIAPLSICYCKKCTAVQLKETVDPSQLFKNYVWVTGTSRLAIDYSNFFCNESLKRCPGKTIKCVEIASNDGTFLIPFLKKGHSVLGVDPALNIASLAKRKGIPTITDFFGVKVSSDIVKLQGHADLVFARNVIPHVYNIHDCVAGINNLLKDKGVGAIEFHYAKKIVDELHYDSIYHEHIFYYTLKSLSYLLKMHGLNVFDLIKSPISGGSLVIYFSKSKRTRSAELIAAIQTEKKCKLSCLSRWKIFARRSVRHKEKLRAIINKLKEEYAPIIGYGASARSSTLFNFCGIGRSELLCIADKNPLKHRRYTAGSGIPIVPPDEAFSKKPKTVFLSAWNFKDEIMAVLKATYNFKGKVIIPLPGEPKVVSIRNLNLEEG